MRLLDTLSGEKKEVSRNKRLNFFVCGPTVYDYSHLGHARTYLTFDMLVRTLRNYGFKVFYLQNITDIDDKIIDRARQENKAPSALAEDFYARYREDMEALHITSVDKYAPATQFIADIIRQVQTLIEKGVAYTIPNDGIYFDISKFPDYGKLSRRTVAEAEDGISRIDESIKKRNRGDFCLWKFSNSDEPSWNTSLGKGRPGWHIEDTAISEHYFGPQYDMHGGAEDLKFPHHEAEIAQQEAASGKKPFVNIWLHAGFLYIDGKKMSKSLNNFVEIRTFLKNHSANLLRWIIFSHHYRSPIHYNDSLIAQHKNSWNTIQTFLEKLLFVYRKSKSKKSEISISELIEKTEEGLGLALKNDFNTPEAAAWLFEVINKTQPYLWKLRGKDAKILESYLRKTFSIFGFDSRLQRTPLSIRIMGWRREQARRNKQFVKSDALRKELEQLGYSLEDTPLGPFLMRQD